MKFAFVWICLFAAQTIIAKPVVVAHRGASGYLPEHTLAAKAMSYAMGVDYIEQDVVLTRDNVPVILHDIHIDTVSDVAKKFPKRKRKDGRYYAIDFKLKELRTLRMEERFNYQTGKRYFPGRFPAKKSKFEIATLAEEIELIQGLNQSTGKEVGLYVEIKHPEFHEKEKKDIAKIVHLVLQEYGYETSPFSGKKPRAFIQCFHAATLKRLKKETKTKIPLIQLIGDNSWKESSTDYTAMQTENGMKEVGTYAYGIGPWMKQLFNAKGQPTPLIKYARANNLKIHTYTARADQLPESIKSFATLHHMLFKIAKVDGVFSDFPDRSVQWVEKNYKRKDS